ncbi:acyltransferase family protein [Microbulbifer sp. JMSA002]|uniref:acyltransferase family protein n=1 Tax=Microbulbifer sp. JMSA002 TaxID=3243368 RepID=UPI0040390151
MPFRADINGLRAIAIIAVLFFHFKSSWLPGGFIGVDIFFVISGFLMTRIIYNGLERGDFSLIIFYAARANRIIPPLFTLCIILLIICWVLLTPTDYENLGKHSIGSAGFFSNIIYWRESGYFDTASHEKWLLHTWSLSVEWQFYLLYPIALLTIRKLTSQNTLKAIILASTIMGFGASIIATNIAPVASFYLLPTRAWEMMLGGLAYLYPLQIKTENTKRIIEGAGLTTIIASCFFISDEAAWPGLLTALPTIGTYLIIQANRDSSVITNNFALQKIGTWSYSIYLWHWPLAVAISYFSLDQKFIYIGLVCSIILGYISYNTIEKRKSNIKPSTSILRHYPLYMVLTTTILGTIVYKFSPNKDFKNIPEKVLDTVTRKQYECFNKKYLHEDHQEFCTLGKGDKKVFAFGDSHLFSALPSIEQVAQQNNLSVTYASFMGCPPLAGIYPIRKDQDERNCHLLNEKIIDHITKENYDIVLLAARWTYYTEGLYSGKSPQYLSLKPTGIKNRTESVRAFRHGISSTLKRLNNEKTNILIMLQVPMQKDFPEKIYMKSILTEGISKELLAINSIKKITHENFQRKTNEILAKESNKYSKVHILNPTTAFCSETHCPVGSLSASYYFDDDHLSTTGSKKLNDLLTYHFLRLAQ